MVHSNGTFRNSCMIERTNLLLGLETTSGNYSYGLKLIHKGPQTSENSDVSIYYPTEYFHKSQYIVTPIVNVCTNRLKICPTVRISHSIRESEVFNDQGQRSLKRHFIFVKERLFNEIDFPTRIEVLSIIELLNIPMKGHRT